MRQISLYSNRFADLYRRVVTRLSEIHEAVHWWIVDRVLWPLGAVSFVLAMLSTLLLVLTFVFGGIILLALSATVQFDQAVDLYGTVLLFEFFAAMCFWCLMFALSNYFDGLNGMC